MAYRFNGTTDVVNFAATPLVGYAPGAFTIAALIKRNTLGTLQRIAALDVTSSRRIASGFSSTNVPTINIGTTVYNGVTALASSAVWYIVVVTWAGGTATPRFHIWDGAAWYHENATASPPGNLGAITAGDLIAIPKAASVYGAMDVVCAAMDKASHTDGEIEALSPTVYQTWKDFAFDWLVGFQASGTITDDSAAGTGDEASRVGTTLVSDPAGWLWTGGGADTTPPTNPSGLTAVADSDTEIDLAWTASSDAVGVTGYKVERKTGAGAFAEVATPSGTSHSDTGLAPSTTYTYRVRATDAAGNLSGYSGEASATTEAAPDTTPPSAPTGLTAVPMGEDATHLDWEPSTDDTAVTVYHVERAIEDSGVFAEIATTSGTSYTDTTGLFHGTVYVYRVRAADAAGNQSGYSETAEAITDTEGTQGVSVAFDDHALQANPVWTRLDERPSFVAAYSIRRGRQDELERTGTGTATVTLNDTEGIFDPTNAESPYIGQMDGRQAALALRNPCTGEWHQIFRGFVDEYNYDLHPSGFVTSVEMELTDAMDYLAGVEVAPGLNGDEPEEGVEVAEGDVYYMGDQVNYRIRALLTEANWPSALRTIFTGNVYVKEQIAAAGTSILALLQDASDAEFPGVANLYVSKKGKVTFHGRLARFDPLGTAASAGSAWTFTRWKAGDGSGTDDPTVAQLRGLGFRRSRKQIINAGLAYPFRAGDTQPEITAAEMEAQVVSDPISIELYGVRSWSAESLMTHRHKTSGTDDLEETRLFAEHYVQNYAYPQNRITQLVFRSLRPDDPRAPATWALLCGVEISDTVRLYTRHASAASDPTPGGFDGDEFYVEGISYEVRPLTPEYADVTMSLDVSPIAYYSNNPFEETP